MSSKSNITMTEQIDSLRRVHWGDAWKEDEQHKPRTSLEETSFIGKKEKKGSGKWVLMFGVLAVAAMSLMVLKGGSSSNNNHSTKVVSAEVPSVQRGPAQKEQRELQRSPIAVSASPTISPQPSVSSAPSKAPSPQPSAPPTKNPTDTPSVPPTPAPSVPPTHGPTMVPSVPPTFSPSVIPSDVPSESPSDKPSTQPTPAPVTAPHATTECNGEVKVISDDANVPLCEDAVTYGIGGNGTVDITIQQCFETSDGTVSFIQPAYRHNGSGRCLASDRVDNVAFGATSSYTLDCNPRSNYATLNVFVASDDFKQSQTDNPYGCADWPDNGNGVVHYSLLVPCTITCMPTDMPSAAPSGTPSAGPTAGPTSGPTVKPTPAPTPAPTIDCDPRVSCGFDGALLFCVPNDELSTEFTVCLPEEDLQGALAGGLGYCGACTNSTEISNSTGAEALDPSFTELPEETTPEATEPAPPTGKKGGKDPSFNEATEPEPADGKGSKKNPTRRRLTQGKNIRKRRQN